jgi:hypothetical protein
MAHVSKKSRYFNADDYLIGTGYKLPILVDLRDILDFDWDNFCLLDEIDL